MKTYAIILLLIVAPFFLSNKNKQKKIAQPKVRDNWSGTVTWSKTSISRGIKTWDDHGKENSGEWDFFFEFKVIATFVNGKGTVVRTEVTTKKEKQKVIFVHKDDKYMIEEKTTKITCGGNEVLELSVEYSEDRKYYWISFFTPDCVGENIYDVTNNITGDVHQRTASEQQGGQITLPADFKGHLVGNDPNVLSGSFLETIPGPPDAGGGDIVTSATWSLTKGAPKPELLVTPISDDADYDNWMPEPGLNESVKGNDINIELHLQDIGGGTSAVKAKFFELRLTNTSKETGVCINAPLTPSAAKPDLRFLPQPRATVNPDGQYIKIPCEDGENGQAVLGSYDGGGWTILTAKATLENGRTVEGVLSQDKSKKDITIPKNYSGGKIAEAWLKDNGNPAENYDKEGSSGNNNDGDGLSAYEEYRGVMSEGRFKRLDPTVKELGVKLKKSDLTLFDGGIKKFEQVTGFKVVRFFENEIPASRRINQNGAHANVYPQFALHLTTGALNNLNGDAIGSPGIPSRVSPVIIDFNNIRVNYQDRVADATRKNTRLPYSEKELTEVAIAHELAHGINAQHHGPGPVPAMVMNHHFEPNATPAGRIFLYNGTEQSLPYTLVGQTGLPGNQQSGDLGCIMSFNFLCEWVGHETPNLTTFYEVPVIPMGGHLCISKLGTGINARGKYFGDATNGNCTAQLKFK